MGQEENETTTEPDSNGNGTGNEQGDVADAISEAVRRIEDAAASATQAALDAGDPDAAERVAGSVVESIERALSDLSDAAEAAESVAEEVAEEAPEGDQAEGAEEAVEEAQEATDAVQEAESEVRDEQREQGGGDQTDAAAADQAVVENYDELENELPADQHAAVEVEEEIAREETAIAESESDTGPALIEPEASHPYFRKRELKVFGRKIRI